MRPAGVPPAAGRAVPRIATEVPVVQQSLHGGSVLEYRTRLVGATLRGWQLTVPESERLDDRFDF
jgi:hypothetical protein